MLVLKYRDRWGAGKFMMALESWVEGHFKRWIIFSKTSCFNFRSETIQKQIQNAHSRDLNDIIFFTYFFRHSFFPFFPYFFLPVLYAFSLSFVSPSRSYFFLSISSFFTLPLSYLISFCLPYFSPLLLTANCIKNILTRFANSLSYNKYTFPSTSINVLHFILKQEGF
jgi:hypothetical protein